MVHDLKSRKPVAGLKDFLLAIPKQKKFAVLGNDPTVCHYRDGRIEQILAIFFRKFDDNRDIHVFCQLANARDLRAVNNERNIPQPLP